MQNLQFFEFTSSNSVKKTFEATFSKIWGNGGVWCVLSLFSPKNETERIGNLLKDTTFDLIMNSVEEDRIKLLTEVLGKTRTILSNITEEGNLSVKNTRLSVGLVLIVDSILYFGKLGDVGCYFQRGQQTLDVSKQLKKNELEVISGKFSENDVLILTAEKLNLAKLDTDWENFSECAGFLIGGDKDAEQLFSASKLPDNFNRDDPGDHEGDSVSNVEDAFELSEKAAEVQGGDESSVEEIEFAENPKVKSIKDFMKLKIENVNKSLFGIFKNISPPIGILIRSIYLKIGRGITWIGETIVGPGKRVRYKMPGNDLYKRRRLVLFILIIFLGLSLYFSINWLKQKNYESKQVKEYEALSLEIGSVLSDAENQISINKTEALKFLNNADSQIDRMRSLEVEGNKWQEFEQKKIELEDQIDNRIRIEKPEVVADLKIWFENANPSDIVYYDNTLWLTDPDAKALYKISADSREVEQALDAGDGLSAPSFMEIIENKFYIYDVKKGLLEYNLESNNVKEVTGLSPTNLGNVTEVSSYDSSIYFLVSDEGKILKASPAGSGFSYPQVRLQDESFKNAKDIEINGLIYTLGSGELIRYYVDTRDSQITISGLNPRLEFADKFELLSSLQLLLLDTKNKRMVVLDQPDGSSSVFKLNKQYTVLDTEDRYFNELKEVVVVPLEKIAYVLDGFRVIKISINE